MYRLSKDVHVFQDNRSRTNLHVCPFQTSVLSYGEQSQRDITVFC